MSSIPHANVKVKHEDHSSQSLFDSPPEFIQLCCCHVRNPAYIKWERDMRLRSHSIDNSLRQDWFTDHENSIKLLLLGPGNSGKSTILKQMRILKGSGFPPDERREFIPLMRLQALKSMKRMLQAARANEPLQDDPVSPTMSTDNAVNLIDSIDMTQDLPANPRIGEALILLWKHPAICVAKKRLQLEDNVDYFFESDLRAIFSPNFVPSEQDILHVRVRTTGIAEHKFMIDGNDLRMYDVGGQRSERKKWIYCFERVSVVFFVAAISSYDQVLIEDNSTNSLHEALNLFKEICGSKWFSSTSIILFLNKKDIFREDQSNSADPLLSQLPRQPF